MAAMVAAILAIHLAAAGDVYKYVAPNGTVVFTDSPRHAGFELWWSDSVAGAYLPNGVPMPRLDRVENLDAYDAHILEAARDNGLPAELIKAVAVAESRMVPTAVSPAGAQGIMQLIPSTASAMGVGDAFDPAQSIRGGSAYLADQAARFGTFELALAAYNAGPNAVVRHGGIPPYAETKTYVARVMGLYTHFKESRPVARR
jgi:soluble lytic murein transglycosylase-like protein